VTDFTTICNNPAAVIHPLTNTHICAQSLWAQSSHAQTGSQQEETQIMEQVIRTSTPRLHPLVIAAAVSVIALSATGIAAFTGVLPMHKAAALDAAPAMTAPAALATAPAAASIAPPTNTVVIQNSTAPAASAPMEIAEPVKPAPKVIRTKVVRPAPAPVVADAGAPVYHPTAVSSSGSDYPPAPPVTPAPAVAQAPLACATCGTIENVREVKQAGDAKGIGAVAGGVGGAVIGKQFGKGNGSTALAVLGAVGGAFAGHQIEKQVRSTTAYEVTVRMEDGSTRTVQQANPPAWRMGERVRVNGDSITML
jgi:outer membrane lipoprotein SlyB